MVGIIYTNTTSKKKKRKKTKSELIAADNHATFLKKMGVKNGGKNSVAKKYRHKANKSTIDHIPSVGNMTGSTAPKDENVYSGERILIGVATMHKSNMVPVFADNKGLAEEIAKMRRN